VEEELVLE
jgi:hypothetical protein